MGTLLPEILREAARQPQPHGGLIHGTAEMSYVAVDRASDRLAAALVARGVEPGSRVVVALPNSPEFVITCFAIWKARAIVVPEATTIRPANLRHILQQVQPVAVIGDRDLAVQLESLPDALRCVTAIFLKDGTHGVPGRLAVEVESLEAALVSETPPSLMPTGAGADDVVSVTFTSGSTGAPKGVMHTHDSWLAAAAFTRDHLAISRSDCVVIPLPLHHAYAFRQILAYVLAGASLVIAPDIYSALNLVRARRPTALLLVPPACNILIDHFASILREADSILRYVEIGAGPMTLERLDRLRELLPTTRIHLSYGLTEARVAFLKPGSDGVPNRIVSRSPGLDLRVVDGQGRAVGPGQTGEIVLRGRGLMKGYWGDPEEAPTRLSREGFRTGDMARVDADGEVALLGRLDDVLKIGGRKLNPFEVEMSLSRHPAVVESVVLGLPDPRGILEQELHAFVVPKQGTTPTPAELLAHCRQYLEPYKIPARIHFRASLPKSPLGKVQRHALLAMVEAPTLDPSKEQRHAGAD